MTPIWSRWLSPFCGLRGYRSQATGVCVMLTVSCFDETYGATAFKIGFTDEGLPSLSAAVCVAQKVG